MHASEYATGQLGGANSLGKVNAAARLQVGWVARPGPGASIGRTHSHWSAAGERGRCDRGCTMVRVADSLC